MKNIACCFELGRATWSSWLLGCSGLGWSGLGWSGLGCSLLCCSLLGLGCAAEQRGWVSPLNSGDRAALVLDTAFARRGNAQTTLANGEQCGGSFNTVAEGVTYDDERPTIIDSEDSQLGLLMLTCPGQRILRCEFSRTSKGTGYGKCNDSSGQLYSLALLNTGAGAAPSRSNEIPKAQASR